MQKIYSRINWENFPSEKTAVNESNLNKMDLAIDNLDDRVVAMDASKVDLTRANELVKEILWDESNGTLTVVKMNGSRAVIDTKLEKLAVNFTYNPQTQQLVITLDDGTVQNVDLSSLITEYEFLDSDTIAFEITDGKVKAIVKNGSITEDKLQPNFLADVKTEVAKAQASQESAADSASEASGSATLAESYAHGGTGTRDGEDSDNARYYMEQAKAVSVVDIATTEKAGIVKPDGTTITVDEDGTLHGQSKVDEMTGATADKDGTSGTVPAPKAGEENMFLRGDGTWAKVSGGSSIAPKATVDPVITNGNAKVTITWGDPDDVIADGVILSTWKGTKLVMKETGYPEDENDGIILVDNKTKDAYVSTGYEVTGLTNGNTYYFKLFPYSTDGIYNYQDSNKLLGNPSLVKLDSCTNMSLSLAMGSVTVSWTDPEATKTVDGNTATWAKTVLVYKQGSIAPMSIPDGIIAVEETVQNTYSTSGFEVLGLTDGQEYTFALFAISTENSYSDAVSASVQLWATLNITTTETTLYEKEVTVTNHVSTVTGTFSSTGSISLNIPWIGSTVITATDGTETGDETIEITAYMDTYSLQFSFVPDGATVTPVDDVAILLKCAEIKDKSYTTMDELLADEQAMGDITMSENAMKYLARSAGFADAVCANETFMTLLGASPYADATVLNSDLWVEKICNSQYMDKVLNDLVPAMTSNTSSVGTAYVSPADSSNFMAYRMFDKDLTTFSGAATESSYPHYYGMNFNSNKMIYAINIPIPLNGHNNYLPKDCILQISDDGSDWKDIKPFIIDNTGGSNNLIVFSPVSTKYIRIKANNGYYTNYNWSGIYEWYIYGR